MPLFVTVTNLVADGCSSPSLTPGRRSAGPRLAQPRPPTGECYWDRGIALFVTVTNEPDEDGSHLTRKQQRKVTMTIDRHVPTAARHEFTR